MSAGKPRPPQPTGHPQLTAALLESARLVEVCRCVLTQSNGEASAKLEPSSTNYGWLGVEPENEGFNPNGINGARNPTQDKLYYFSTIRKPDGTTVLLLTNFDESDHNHGVMPHRAKARFVDTTAHCGMAGRLYISQKFHTEMLDPKRSRTEPTTIDTQQVANLALQKRS